MENGANGATGASARQNIRTVHRFAIDFVTPQLPDTAANIARYNRSSLERDLQIELQLGRIEKLFPILSQGFTTETRPCSGSISNIWEYFFGRKTFGSINSTEIMEEVGPNCQCGCIIHLLKSKPRRMLASSSQACLGLENAMWTIQVGDENVPHETRRALMKAICLPPINSG